MFSNPTVDGTGTTIFASSTPPENPVINSLWYDTTTGKSFVYFDDGESQQWVLFSNPTTDSGTALSASSTPPTNPTANSIWYDTTTGKTFVYFDDGESQQWVLLSDPTKDSGSALSASNTPPENPVSNSLWYDTSTGKSFVFLDDGDSQQWVLFSDPTKDSGSGTTVFASNSPPENPAINSIWYDSSSGKSFVYFDDGESQQWVLFSDPTIESISGFSGFSGYSGQVGETGSSGFSGFSGQAGSSGFSGIAGSSGSSGFSGASGFSGNSGYSGLSGFSGIQGSSGSQGPQGTSGFSGVSGYSGVSGWSGFSGAGTALTVSSNQPSNPALNSLWYDSDTGKTFAYINNGWVLFSDPTITGGGGSSGQRNPDNLPISPTLFDDEFNVSGNNLDPKWAMTSFNGGTPTYSINSGYLIAVAPYNSGPHLILQNINDNTFKIRGKIAASTPDLSFDNYNQVGLSLYHSGTQKHINFTKVHTDSPKWELSRWNGSSFSNATAITYDGGSDESLREFHYMEVECDGTNIYCRISKTGVDFSTVFTETLTTFLGAGNVPDKAGFMTFASNATSPNSAILVADWIRKIEAGYDTSLGGSESSGGASVTVSDTAPTSPVAGDLWWDSTSGKLKIYYNDGSSSQWVDAFITTGAQGPQGSPGSSSSGLAIAMAIVFS